MQNAGAFIHKSNFGMGGVEIFEADIVGPGDALVNRETLPSPHRR